MSNQVVPAVLNRHEIAELCCQERPLIAPADTDPDNVRKWPPASYDLTLGRWARVGRVLHDLDSGERTLRIPPHEVAYVETEEILSLPNNLVATFGLRMKWVFLGLIIPPQTQIDPGYHGRIFILLFNLSNTPVHLARGEHIISVEFRRIAPTEGYNGPRQGVMSLTDAVRGIPPVESGLAALARSFRKWELTLQRALVIALALITLLVAVLGVIVAVREIRSTATQSREQQGPQVMQPPTPVPSQPEGARAVPKRGTKR